MNELATTPWNLVVFATDRGSATVEDVIRAGFFRGDLAEPWKSFVERKQALQRIEESGEQADDGTVQAISEEFRSSRDLITAEETEEWLNSRGVTLHQFSDFCLRTYWAQSQPEIPEPLPLEYGDATAELRDEFRVELLLNGEFDRCATRLAWRCAAREKNGDAKVDRAAIDRERAEFLERLGLREESVSTWLAIVGADEQWLQEMLEAEAVFHAGAAALISPAALNRMSALLRLPLTQFVTEVLEVESLHAAREAALCVRLDGMTLEAIGLAEAYPFHRRTVRFEQLDAETQQAMLRAAPGDLLDPIDLGEGVQLCRLVEKLEPDSEDPRIRNRLESEIIEQHFSNLAAAHVRWVLTSAVVS